MNCPRCGLSMMTSTYENEKVLCCQSCWGYWLSTTQLDAILHNLVYKFDHSEKQKILTATSQGHGAIPPQKDNIIKCPECHNIMAKRPYHEECPIVIDQCPLHGIWLDTGELKALQIYVEQEMKVPANSSMSQLIQQIKSMDKRLVAVEEKLDFLISFIRKVRGE